MTDNTGDVVEQLKETLKEPVEYVSLEMKTNSD